MASSSVQDRSPLLKVRELRVDFGRRHRPALRGIDFDLAPGQRLGLIGESGSGKSVTALALMGLLPENAHISGSMSWQGRELVGLGDAEYTGLRGKAMSMIFQEPMTALDPTMRVGRQVAEALRLHNGAPAGKARQRVLEMLTQVGLADPSRVADSFPHQLSGGQRQRCLTAMALINEPQLVICDEPTTALDVTVQARVITVLRSVLDQVNAACLFISHDLAVVSQVCDDLMVMYRGELVEAGPLDRVLSDPQHPYTKGLIATASIGAVAPGDRLPEIEDFWNPGSADVRDRQAQS